MHVPPKPQNTVFIRRNEFIPVQKDDYLVHWLGAGISYLSARRSAGVGTFVGQAPQRNIY